MSNNQYDYTVFNHHGKRLCETNDIAEARRVYWRTPYAQHPAIVYGEKMMEKLVAMQLAEEAYTMNEDVFKTSSGSGLVLCSTIIPKRDAGVPYEHLTFVPPMCYKNLPPDERSALHAIKRTF